MKPKKKSGDGRRNWVGLHWAGGEKSFGCEAGCRSSAFWHYCLLASINQSFRAPTASQHIVL
jgi:hypothetical protein